MAKVLISGGSGLIGTKLIPLLINEGYQVAILSRSARNREIESYQWDIDRGFIEEEAITASDYIIHLAGAGIADKRWTKNRKKVIYNSRVASTMLLYSKLKQLDHQVKAFISTSAIGYYGSRGADWLNEEATPGIDFLANVCKDWEAQAIKIGELGIRTIINRLGIVLTDKGGALPEISKTIKLGVAPYLGDGQQYYSWVHIDDVCGILLNAIKDDKIEGTYNVVAPNPVTNKDLTRAIVKAKGVKALLIPTPKIALKMALGEMSQTVLGSQRCAAEKLIKSGYEFLFDQVDDALDNIYS